MSSVVVKDEALSESIPFAKPCMIFRHGSDGERTLAQSLSKSRTLGSKWH